MRFIILKTLLLFFIISFSSLSFSLEGLQCSKLGAIQESYISKHVSQYRLSKKLQNRVVEQLIKYLDSEKLYFIQSDIHQMQKWFRHLFKDVQAGNCTSLTKLYNLFVQRMKERVAFAKDTISKKDFVLDPTVKILLDSDERNFAQGRWQLGSFHKKYIQYELASIMSGEDDLSKAKNHLLGIYDRKLKTILSWNPYPSKEQLQYCKKEDKKNRSVKTCKYEKWYSIYLDSFAKSLDPHSSYLSRYELEDFEINMQLSLEGVGASLSSQYGYTVVERLLPGGAAFLSKKIKRKDKIIAIGQSPSKLVSIFGWDLRDVVQMVRGKKGTAVYLKLLRTLKDGNKKRFVVRLVRQKIHLQDSASSLILSKRKINGKEQAVGVIRIPSFYGGGSGGDRSVAKDVKKLINQAVKKHKVEAIVLDLSGNGGGVLSEAVDVTGLFLKSGNIVRQMAKTYDRKSIYYTLKDEDDRIFYRGPLVVLVDRSSASASEIVAGALKDYKRAVIVGGNHTFGKGSIQSVENIGRNLGAIKTTIGLYYVPSGKSIQKMGIDADIVFPSMLSIDEYGEKTLDYVLPRQHTSSFLTRFDKKEWNVIQPSLIRKLQVKSKLRVKQSDKFKKILKDVAKLEKKIKDKKKISISTFLTDAKKRNEEEQDLEEDLVLDTKDPKFQKKYLERASISEAVNIAWDLSQFSHPPQSFVKTN